jgi:uncharacterized membrane protein
MENRDWEKIAMKNKKIIIIVISIILILAISVGIGITIYFNNKPKNKPEDVLQTFASYINDKKYEDMYSLLSFLLILGLQILLSVVSCLLLLC